MKPLLIIRIPEPCEQQWNDMSITTAGRFCSSCTRELVDFTRFSDRELVEYLAEHTGKLCGRFARGQLDRNLLTENRSFQSLSLPALALLAAMLTINPVHAQADTLRTVVTIPNEKDSLHNYDPEIRTIRGTVNEAFRGEPLWGTVIELKNKGMVVQRTHSDLDGHFSFILPEGLVYDTLKASLEGYCDTLVPCSENPIIVLEPNEPLLIEEIGMIYISKKQMRRNRRTAKRAAK
jgi:hypothetical protein